MMQGRSPDASIRESLEVARHCEALGYSRYWLAEHHNSEATACAAPEILMAAIAATTARIRVGSAGIMLPHYSALKVAEQFRVLEAIAPGRIDLGVGRAHGCDLATALALNPLAETALNHFRTQVRDLMAWVSGVELAEGHPHRGISAQPRGPSSPEIWMLGSTDHGAQLAAQFGLPFCFAHFIATGRGIGSALAIYRETYQPSERHPTPHAALCVWATAVEACTGTEVEKSRIAQMGDHLLFGAPEQVGAMLRNLAAAHGIDDIVLLSTVGDPETRRRSYMLLAKEFSLGE
jgi:luciferase family oxidoreductase group 1